MLDNRVGYISDPSLDFYLKSVQLKPLAALTKIFPQSLLSSIKKVP
jgi:hypothetical protein